MIEPIIPSLYFNDVDGFGAWRILLSTKVQMHLRLEARCGSGGMFGTLMGKMK